MCDYSLTDVQSRPAKVGDKLTSHYFNTGSSGFKEASDNRTGKAATAICVLPGTEIAFANAIKYDVVTPYLADVEGQQEQVGGEVQSDLTTATFVQVNKKLDDHHHDALRFADGTIVMLQWLKAGQEAVVLQLPGKPKNRKEREFQKRAAYV